VGNKAARLTKRNFKLTWRTGRLHETLSPPRLHETLSPLHETLSLETWLAVQQAAGACNISMDC